MHKRQRRSRAAWALLGAGVAAGALLSAGCGSSSTDPTARIRTVDLSGNSGTVGILVNGAANGGDLNFGSASPYNYVGQGISTFSFSSNTTVPTGITYPPSAILQLNNSSFYTAYLIGRADVVNVNNTTDPRFLQTVVTGDRGAATYAAGTAAYTAPPSGQANLRILNGAPDAGYTGPNPGMVDVLINGHIVFSNVSYPKLLSAGTTGATAVAATQPTTPYQAVPSGTLSIQVNVAGTATVVVPPTNVSLSGGGVYTVVVTEPTTAPTYGLYTASD